MPGNDIQPRLFVVVATKNIYAATISSDLLLTLSMLTFCTSVFLIPLFLFALALGFGNALKLEHGVKNRGIYNGHMVEVCANVPVTEIPLDMKHT